MFSVSSLERRRVFPSMSPSIRHFEPVDCTKGDVARVWFYGHHEHGLVIPDATWNVLVQWADQDPVSPWESERGQADRRG